MSAGLPASRPIRVLELRTVTGQGGGPEKTLLNGAAAADPRRLVVTLCFLRRPDPQPLWVEPRAAATGVDYVEIGDRHPLDPRTWPSLRRLVRDRGIDIVHSHDYKVNLYAWLLGRVERVLLVATAHGWTGCTPRERLLYYPADRLLLGRFPKVIAVSREIRAQLLGAGADPQRVEVLLNGVATAAVAEAAPTREEAAERDRVRREWGLVAGERVVGTVGRLEPQKRVDLLLEAFAAVRRRFEDARLVIVGDGDLARPLRRQAEAIGIAADVRFLGYRHDVDRLQAGFDVYVQASSYEGSANAVLEAMAGGTPLVATAVGGTGELISDQVHGLLVEPGSAAALAAAIESVFEQPALAATRARSARDRAMRELSFERRQERLLEIYESLVRTDRRGAGDGFALPDGAAT